MFFIILNYIDFIIIIVQKKAMLQNIANYPTQYSILSKNITQSRLQNKEARSSRLLGQNLESCCLLSVSSIKGLLIESALYFVKNAIQNCVKQRDSGQTFKFDVSQYFIDQKGNLIFLPNSFITKKSVIVQEEAIVVQAIVHQISKICYSNSFEDFLKYYQRSSVYNKCDFKYSLSMIQVYSKCARIIISSIMQFCKQGQCKTTRKNICELISKQRMSQISQISKSLKKSVKIRKATSECAMSSNPLIKQITVKSINNQSQFIQNGAKQQKTRQSSASTAFKSSINDDSIQGSSINFNNKLGGSYLIDPYKIKVNRSLFPVSLQQIDSQSQQTDKDHQSHLTVKKPSQTESRIVQRQNEQRILAMNQWEKKVSKLVKESTMKQSYTIETEAQRYFNSKNSLESALLGKMARVVVKSLLPVSQ